MIKILSGKYVILLLGWIFLVSVPNSTDSSVQTLPGDFVTAKAAFLMDAHTGAILYEKKPDLRLPPASTTKIMTAIVALEHKSPGTFLRVSKNATLIPPCKIAVRNGDEWRLEDLLRCILLNSANDASVVIAEGVAGSVEKFAQLMNLKAKNIGASNTHFANPHGLNQKNHYATVRDMTLIFKHAMKYSLFREISQTKSMSIKGPHSRLIHLRNHNRLLSSFAGMVSGKTGYTRQAKKCFVGEAVRNGKDLLVCVFGSQDHFRDAARLLEYGFNGDAKEFNDKNYPVQNHESVLPLSSPCENGNYVLQVASFSDRGKALDLKQSLLEEGFTSFIEEVSFEKGGVRHRVKVGFYPDLESAQRTKERIWKRFRLDALILYQ